MKFTLPYPPSTNNLFFTTKTGLRVPSKEYQEYKKTAALMAIKAGVRVVLGNVCVTVNVYRKRKAGDLDNTLKATFDSLKGIAWADDSQVKKIIAERFDDPSNPRAEIEVEPMVGSGSPLF